MLRWFAKNLKNLLNQIPMSSPYAIKKKIWWSNEGITSMTFVEMRGEDVIFILKSIVHHESLKDMG